MEITQSSLQALRTSFSLLYREAYSSAPIFYKKIATQTPSSSATNTYGWMAQLPRMREWLGERVVNNLSEHAYVLGNRLFELTYGLDRSDIEDDNIGVFQSHMAEMGNQVAKHPDDLMVTLLQNGQNNLCFDGQAFFATAHPMNANDSTVGTYSNYSSSGMALTNDNYETVRQLMMAFKGDNGQPLGIIPDLLIVPPQLEPQAKRILTAEFLPNTAGTAPQINVNVGTAERLTIPEFANQGTVWYLACTNKAMKPFVHQLRRAPAFVQRTELTSENVFNKNRFEFGSDTRDNAGYTLPFLCYKAAA